MTHDQTVSLRPRLVPHPVTAPWVDPALPGTLYSWECAYPGGAPVGITDDEEAAVRAVNDVLRRHGGQGLVQKCQRGSGPTERDQYAYGHVVGRARLVEPGTVAWSVP